MTTRRIAIHLLTCALCLVTAATARATVSSSFIGVSLEYSGIAPYYDANPTRFEQLIRGLSPNPVIRIGGDSSGVTSADTLTPEWLTMVQDLSDATNASLIMDLNFRHPELMKDEAFKLVNGLSRISALEIGNEPERLARSGARPAGYSPDDYVAEARSLVGDLPPLPLAGPATGVVAWLPAAIQSGIFSTVTLHRYPLSNCTLPPPSIPALLSGDRLNIDRAAPYVRFAHAENQTFRMDELNTVSCQGLEGVSDTQASALWAIDSLFEAARIGVDGVNFHMWPGAVPNQLWTTNLTPRPIYGGILLFHKAAPAGSNVTPLHSTSTVKQWGTSGHVMLLNEGTTTQKVFVRAPYARSAAVTRLLATSIDATANQIVSSPRIPSSSPQIPSGGAGFTVVLPPASATLLSFAAPRVTPPFG